MYLVYIKHGHFNRYEYFYGENQYFTKMTEKLSYQLYD